MMNTFKHFSSLLILLITINILISGSIITFAKSQEEQVAQEIQDIYGIRWFLGDYFAFHMPQTLPSNQEMFILMFNSKEELDDQIFLKINGTRYGCYERFLEIQRVGEHHYEHSQNASHQVQNFTNFMYKCIVYAQNFGGLTEVNYQIISGWAIFQGQANSTIVNRFRQDVLFQGKLRIPQNMDKLSFLFFGDWGIISKKSETEKGYKDVMPALLKNLKENPSIGMFVFGGDLAYDFEGQMSIDMLTYMQPLTSCVPMLVTPGNHESVYHEDSFELFVQSFYTPMWYKYFNYFSLVQLQSQKLIIISYDPQNSIFPGVNRLNKNLTQVFDNQLNKTISAYIKNNYDVIAFSHYPVYCSQDNQIHQSCQLNKVRLKPFMNKFQQIGLDLYLSGHLHTYQRTKQMCNQTNVFHNQSNLYTKTCPLYVIEGTPGNDDYVQLEIKNDPKNFSEVTIFGTGYGITTINRRNLTYQHFKVVQKQNSTLADSFTIFQSLSDNSKDQDRNNKGNSEMERTESKFILILQVTALVIVAGVACYMIYRFRKNTSNANDGKQVGHVEMMEQNFQTPPNQQNKSKQQDGMN